MLDSILSADIPANLFWILVLFFSDYIHDDIIKFRAKRELVDDLKKAEVCLLYKEIVEMRRATTGLLVFSQMFHK